MSYRFARSQKLHDDLLQALLTPAPSKKIAHELADRYKLKAKTILDYIHHVIRQAGSRNRIEYMGREIERLRGKSSRQSR